MASNKKKSSAKPRMVNLTEDKTSVFVRNADANVNKMFQRMMRESNIPVFINIAKDTTIARYMLNRKLYKEILGSCISISDYMLKVAIGSESARQLTAIICNPGNDVVYPGNWELECMIWSMMMTQIVPIVEDDNDMCILSSNSARSEISEGELLESDEHPGTMMRFSEYNPNRLYQLIMHTCSISASTIVNQINKTYPLAYASTNNNPTNVRMARELGIAIKESVDKIDIQVLSGDANERNVLDFLHAIEKPMLNYITLLVQAGGINPDLINKMISGIDIQAVYENANKHHLEDVIVTYIFGFPEKVDAAHKPLKTSFTFTIKSMLELCSAETSKSRFHTFGTKIRKLMNELINVCLVFAIDDNNAEESEIESDALENEV